MNFTVKKKTVKYWQQFCQQISTVKNQFTVNSNETLIFGELDYKRIENRKKEEEEEKNTDENLNLVGLSKYINQFFTAHKLYNLQFVVKC